MKIDCSEPEQCDYVFVTTQESEQSSVIASSVTSMPDSSQPVEALGRESAAIVSTSTSSPISSAPAQASVTDIFGSGASAATIPAQSTQAFNFGSGASAASTSSTSSPFAAPSPFRCGSMEAPAQSSAPNTSSFSFSFRPAQDVAKTGSVFASSTTPENPFSSLLSKSDFNYSPGSPFNLFGPNPPPPPPSFNEIRNTALTSPLCISTTVLFGTTPVSVSSTLGPTQGFAKTGSVFASSTTPKNPSFNLFGPNPPPPTGFNAATMFPSSSSSLAATISSTERGSRYPPYAPTPCDSNISEDQYKMMSSISASNYYGNKSHEELRWEDYKRGDKGEVRSSPAAQIPPTFSWPKALFSEPTVPPPLFASPIIPDHPQQGTTQGNMTGFPAAVERPHETGSDFNYVPRPPSNPFGPNNPSNSFFPGPGVNYLPGPPPNPFGPPLKPFGPNNPSNSPFRVPPTPVSGDGLASDGSRYPPYAPTPGDYNSPEDQYKMMSSISASNYYGNKSHEELRWEDYKRGDKGEVRSSPATHISPTFSFSWPRALYSEPTVPPSLFASPRIPDHPQQRTTHGNMTDFPAAVQRPHGVSPQASGCTACGATSSPSASGPTNPPSAATSLPGSLFSTSGSYPMMSGTPNLAAQGTITTPALQPYPMMFGTTYLAAQGTTTTPAFQAYPMMFGASPAAQGTNLAVQSTTPAFQAYPMMFGASPAAQGTNLAVQSTTPAVQAVAGYILLPVAAINPQ